MKVCEEYDLRVSDWYNYGEWQQPPLSAQTWVHWFIKYICKELGFNGLDGRLIMLNGHTIVSKNDFKVIKDRIIRAYYKKETGFFSKFNKIAEEISKNHIKLSSRLSKPTNLKKDFKLFNESSRKVTCIWTLSVFLGEGAGDLLVSESLKHGLALEDVVANVKPKKTLLVKEYEAMAKIKKAMNSGNNARAARMIENHIKKYAWVGTHHFWGEQLTKQKLLKELSQPANRNKLDSKLKIPAQLKFLTEISAQQSYWRQYLAEVFDLAAFKVRPLLFSIAKMLGVSYDELIFLTPEEIINCLGLASRPDKAAIKRREKDFCIFLNKDKEVVVDDSTGINWFKANFLKADSKFSGEIKGIIASKGVGKGVVKVFLVPKNLEKMKDGDVLVTTMTTPDFVPLMKKAIAIVTDVGGLLSHAALISREMKRPCIIGTKIATKVLKDGDLVEVDANKGVVRKIK